jgi:hypothetical protein
MRSLLRKGTFVLVSSRAQVAQQSVDDVHVLVLFVEWPIGSLEEVLSHILHSILGVPFLSL